MDSEMIKNLKPGTLLRVAKHCRKNIAILQSGEYAILAPKQVKTGKSIVWDVLYPDGRRSIFVPMNWEVVSYAPS